MPYFYCYYYYDDDYDDEDDAYAYANAYACAYAYTVLMLDSLVRSGQKKIWSSTPNQAIKANSNQLQPCHDEVLHYPASVSSTLCSDSCLVQELRCSWM